MKKALFMLIWALSADLHSQNQNSIERTIVGLLSCQDHGRLLSQDSYNFTREGDFLMKSYQTAFFCDSVMEFWIDQDFSLNPAKDRNFAYCTDFVCVNIKYSVKSIYHIENQEPSFTPQRAIISVKHISTGNEFEVLYGEPPRILCLIDEFTFYLTKNCIVVFTDCYRNNLLFHPDTGDFFWANAYNGTLVPGLVNFENRKFCYMNEECNGCLIAADLEKAE